MALAQITNPVQPGVMPLGTQIQPQLGQAGPTLAPQQPGFNPPGFNPGGVQLPPTGLIGSEQALQTGLQGALSGVQQGRQGVLGQTNLGAGQLDQFVAPGQQAQQRQAALSGALGQGAQQQAFQSFMDSPEQAFLRERGDLAVTRNAAALGGLGGGRVQQELQRQGIGLAAQDFQNQFNRLGDVTGQGLQAAGLSGQLRGQAGSMLGQLGQTAGGFAQRSGQDLAAGRTQAGRDIAQSIGGTSSALSNLVSQQGQGASDLIGAGGSNLAGLLSGAGAAQGLNQEQLAALLSGQQLTGSGQIAGQPGIPGVSQSGGIIGELGQAAAGAGTLIGAFSDRRLKTNIQRVGTTPGGTGIYTWDWTTTGKRLAGNQATIGVIAQDVPEATTTGPDGYLMVDYSRVT